MNKSITKQFVATKAFIEYNKKILILKESPKYKDGTNVGDYIIPGGRVKLGEKFNESLKREIKEETGLEIIIDRPFFISEWWPKVQDEKWQIIGIFFICQAHSNKVSLDNDHDDFKWINPKDYQKYIKVDNLKLAFREYLKLVK